MMVVKCWDTTFILYRAALKILEFLSEKVKNLDPNLFLSPGAIIPTTMSILTVNVRSLKKHLNDLEALVHSLESPPNVICLTETWLTMTSIPYWFQAIRIMQLRIETHLAEV